MDFILDKPEETKEILLKLFWNSEKTEENLAIVGEYYSFLKTVYDRRNVPPEEGAELLIKIAKAGEFESIQEVEGQNVTLEEIQKVFDFHFVK
jgi:hypothetical protein